MSSRTCFAKPKTQQPAPAMVCTKAISDTQKTCKVDPRRLVRLFLLVESETETKIWRFKQLILQSKLTIYVQLSVKEGVIQITKNPRSNCWDNVERNYSWSNWFHHLRRTIRRLRRTVRRNYSKPASTNRGNHQSTINLRSPYRGYTIVRSTRDT